MIPEYTSNATGLGTLRILETIKNLKNKKKIKYYQAGSSELFGNTKQKKKMKKLHFIQEVHILWLNFILTGSQ